MQFTLSTFVSLIAAAEVTAAWQIIGYLDTHTCDDRNRNRVLRGGNAQSACFTFGKGMPGVSCTEYARNGAPGEGCIGNLPISSVRVGTGESCAFYSGEGCSGDTSVVNRVNDCVAFSGRNQVRSYKCHNA